MERLIEAIVSLEWEMFHAVNDGGEKADCQNNFATFQIMRRSQLCAWSRELAASWYADLMRARQAGRNLMTEKYGYMMRFTVPEEYAQLAHRLPPVSEEKRETAEQIVSINSRWDAELAAAYPHVAARGRPLTHREEAPDDTSVETYLRCELWTYSERTLRIMLDYFHSLEESGQNYAEMVLTNTVTAYGYASLSQAEEQLSR